jgi:hypothetical protein
MSDDDLSEKFTDNAAPRLGAERAAELLTARWKVDSAPRRISRIWCG